MRGTSFIKGIYFLKREEIIKKIFILLDVYMKMNIQLINCYIKQIK